ncbi:MAG: TolC family protein [Bacteroidota bacterium]
MSKQYFIITALLILYLEFQPSISAGQDYELTLEQVVELAKKQSPEMVKTETILENKYWQYQSYKSNYKPQLQLTGELPNFNRTISPITQDDGTQAFKSRSYSSSSLTLGISQNIGFTGGVVTLGTQLERMDGFSDSSTVDYLANPAVISITQPILSFNPQKWDKKIEPVRYEASKREYIENIENISVLATELFFDLLLAQKSKVIAETNLANNDTLYQIARGRYNLGKIAEDGLLQMELSVMNARNDLYKSQMDVQTANLRLAMFLGMTGKETISLIAPVEIPDFEVNEQVALEQALANSSLTLDFDLNMLQAERSVDKAKGESGFNADIYASYGLTNSTSILDDLYNDPRDHQRLLIGFNVPILDWGRARARMKTALANKKLMDVNVKQEKQNFEQEILLLVREFNIYKLNLEVAEKAEEVADKRYDVTMKRYKIGKIEILDLNVARQEKDLAKKSYIQSLENFWNTYYDLRKRTLYDFELNKVIGGN